MIRVITESGGDLFIGEGGGIIAAVDIGKNLLAELTLVGKIVPGDHIQQEKLEDCRGIFPVIWRFVQEVFHALHQHMLCLGILAEHGGAQLLGKGVGWDTAGIKGGSGGGTQGGLEMLILPGEVEIQNNDPGMFFEENIEAVLCLWWEEQNSFVIQPVGIAIDSNASGNVVKEEYTAVIADA